MSRPRTPAADDVSRLRLAVMRIARRVRQEGAVGTTPSQTAVLFTLALQGSLRLGELAAQERVRPPTMTRIVAGLEARGLVERTPDPRDGRVAVVALTPAGRAEVAAVRSRSDTWLAGRIDALGPAEGRALLRALPALERLLDAATPAARDEAAR